MPQADLLQRHLSRVSLQRLGGDGPAGLAIASLPLPRNARQGWTIAGRRTFVKPLGRWYDAASPRRLLMVADCGGKAPRSLRVARAGKLPEATLPAVEMETFAHAPAEHMPLSYWERSLLRIAWQGKSIGLAMGMRVKGEVHWWECCNIVVRRDSPAAVEVEMGGVIPYEVTTHDTMQAFQGKDNPYIHKHNWVNGHVLARLHANGVCEVYAHHVNSMFFDDGADFKDAVPVIGFRVEGGERAAGVGKAWDGTRRELDLAGIAFDMTDVARLATPEKPGRLDAAGGFVVLQPYRGVELHGGYLTKLRLGDDYWWRAEQEIFPRGMARTLRFSLSLNPKRSPRVARYIAPAWWYGLCEEYQPRPVLPVSNEYDESLRTARQWFDTYMIKEGFEEGMTPQGTPPTPRDRLTPSGEGDLPAGLFFAAYRAADAVAYDNALRTTYAIVDVFVDHAVNRTRFPGHQAGAVALPLQRMHGPVIGWLETGDEYLLNTAVAVVDTAYSWHKNSWPRRAVGRDARFVHGQMVLYRYLGQAHYLERTRSMIADLAVAQWEDGSFGDQGGGSGIHGYAAYIIKPWMGCLATLGVMDYLEQFPDDKAALAVVKKFVDFLMRERGPRVKDHRHPEKGAVMGWTYQHAFKGKPLAGYTAPVICAQLSHLYYMARLLTWYSFRTGDPKYFDAFAESYEGAGRARDGGYHHGTQVFMFIPWLQDRLWDATVTKKGIEVRATYLGERTPKSGSILTPDGDKKLVWSAPGKLKAPKGVHCKVEDLTAP